MYGHTMNMQVSSTAKINFVSYIGVRTKTAKTYWFMWGPLVTKCRTSDENKIDVQRHWKLFIKGEKLTLYQYHKLRVHLV